MEYQIPTVLMVEDSAPLSAVYQAYLKHEAVTLISVASGAEALQQLPLLQPDILLLDLHLPDMSGMEILKHVQASALGISTIVMTANGSLDMAVDAMRLGVDLTALVGGLALVYLGWRVSRRFAAAAADGFKGVEYLFPYAFAASDIAQRLQDHGLQQVLFNAPPGNWDAGERGLACLPGREAEFREGIAKAVEYAQALQCPRIHVMAGLVPQGADATSVRATYIANVRYAAEQAAPHGIQILLEPINGRDMPGFFLSRQDQAHALIAEIGAANVKVQMDLYHCQIVEGDLAMKVRQYLPTGNVGHFQIAGVPERHEPDVGEINYTYLFQLLDNLGYDGWIGCEYRPARGTAVHATSDGLGWLKPWL